ncbi:serine--tRNA ligase [candidate division WWE3 bacterium RIFOXYC2_FULL_42_13]|uniref:Serine--tRNA ligase n=2 Tax=Katanobacteria TaxID=422282 RepID=A0A0G1EQ13_UNCKA|nr:MAG: Serine-tRNA ligase [candidate division WWE3 bacterium GW2011_GWB2_43_22]OGC58487.1 MAG: serine--tRNA ligase [candidate division WWE3 bacterium RIFOXYA2_FULL_43_12]OGC66886.1 MAG: serine--tRNA ligase [candidate division WWE3 bacterium RIFOXYA12_FULL_43_11]OGC73394.1 MAG: serine--tRNA ligase [candidate division WWE3 bacterium RIFOXYC2_FULL_42_13]HBY09848.1 serine--tRNA ligase [candidate division WWE3 bacterium]
MLDINYIKNNTDKVKKAVEDKQLTKTVSIDKLIETHDGYLDLLKKVETHRALRNKLSESISKVASQDRSQLINEASAVKEELGKYEHELTEMKIIFDQLMLWVPSVPAEDVPVGQDESGNKVVREEGNIIDPDFKPKDHVDLGQSLDIMDLERGAKIGGFRGYFLKNEGAQLEQAILRYACDMMLGEGYTMLSVPWIVKPEFFTGTGYFPWGEDDHYRLEDDKALIGTAEVSLTSYYSGEILNESELPVRLFGLSPCFRKEIGAYGKDTKGIFRLHQFNKVEQVVLTTANEEITREWHEKMLSHAENILKGLNLPYRVLLMCTGDMGAGQVKKYDLETWFPSQSKYRETHSDSYFRDFQSRRLNIKYRDSTGELKYVYTLNNTVAATPRLLAAVLENYQNADGSVTVPEVLRQYVNFDKILPKKKMI